MRISLAAKISLAVVGVLLLAVLSTVVAIVSAYRFEAFQQTLIVDNLASVRAAEELEIGLLEQRGYVASYILDEGNEKERWLKGLNAQRHFFDDWLAVARQASRSDRERDILSQLEIVQGAYSKKRDEVVTLYKSGRKEEAKHVLLHEVSDLYQQSFELCEEFIDANQQQVDETSADVRDQVDVVSFVVTATLIVTLILGLVLLWLFFRGVILPLRKITADARRVAGDSPTEDNGAYRDELRELGHHVQLLMTNVAETRSDLEQSRTRLAHAEKLAAVGKLAASVAHEIRNPLTAIKMWLYSLRRSLRPNDESREKLDVVSEEITRLENIVRNFLEFSRPAQLNLCRQNVGELLDKTLDLQKCRLAELKIELVRQDEPDLPDAMVDVEQLRQVFVNLINNAVEAMPHGGQISISLSRRQRGGRSMLVITLADTGPGMPVDVQERIFEPFFTTKESGTGLGLCIAASIMARHKGSLQLESSNFTGTKWSIWIPAASDARAA